MVEHDHEMPAACAAARDEFSALLDDELAPGVRTELETHLAGCSDCLRALDGMKKASDLYAALPRVPAPDTLEARVARALRPGLLRWPSVRVAGLATLAAAAGAAIVLAPMLLERLQSATPQQQLAKQAEMRAAPTEAGEDGLRQYHALGYTADEVAPGPPPAASPPAVLREPVAEAPEAATSMLAVADIDPSGSAAAPDSVPQESASAIQDAKEEDETPEKFEVAAAAMRAPDAAPASQVPEPSPTAAPAPKMRVPEPQPEPAAREAAPGGFGGGNSGRGGMGGFGAAAPAAKASPEQVPAPAAAEMKRADSKDDARVTWLAAGRTFVLIDNVWVEEGRVLGEVMPLAPGSQEFTRLTKAFPDLLELASARIPVLFYQEPTWYRLLPKDQ